MDGKNLKTGRFSDEDRRMIVSAYENDPQPGRQQLFKNFTTL